MSNQPRPTEIDKADVWRQAHTRLIEENLALKQQLAAERHTRDGFRRALEQRIGEIDELRKELAAERENAEKAAVRAEQAQIQLDAERHKRETCEVLIRDLQKELTNG